VNLAQASRRSDAGIWPERRDEHYGIEKEPGKLKQAEIEAEIIRSSKLLGETPEQLQAKLEKLRKKPELQWMDMNLNLQ